jgi:transposase-like protein
MHGGPVTMAASNLVDLSGLMDDAKCVAFVRQRRWPEGVRCPGCGSDAVIRDGRDDAQPDRQRYRCKACAGRFLSGTQGARTRRPAGGRRRAARAVESRRIGLAIAFSRQRQIRIQSCRPCIALNL